jgi:cob(I)alamin adenosyltransferase
MDRGYVQVYTGDGKGKTTAAIGLCVRALGAGLSVHFGQFIKGMRYAEISALESLAAALPGAKLTIRQYGRGCFVGRSPNAADREAASAGLAESVAAARSGGYDLVVLDEASVACSLGLIDEDALVAVAAEKAAGTELVITGRRAGEKLLRAADLVTEMREVRHYYARGVAARDGIER